MVALLVVADVGVGCFLFQGLGGGGYSLNGEVLPVSGVCWGGGGGGGGGAAD